ncbi:MAG: hypothetical protein ACRDIB_18255 [Ardenticatenaceae bacterium]
MFITQAEDRIEFEDGWAAVVRRHWTAGDQEALNGFMASYAAEDNNVDPAVAGKFRLKLAEMMLLRFVSPDGEEMEATPERVRSLEPQRFERIMSEVYQRVPLGKQTPSTSQFTTTSSGEAKERRDTG